MNKRTYQFDFGKYKGFVIHDQSQVHSAEELVVNPIVEELEQIAPVYDFELQKIPVGYNTLLFKVDDQYVLVDAGIRSPMGKLRLGLEELEIDPVDIDTIVITHSDRDHIGGILDEEGIIAFPNARFIMLEDSWQHWSSKESRAELTRLNNWTKDKTQFIWETYSKIKDRILLVQPGEMFIPGFQLFPAPGHRQDHSYLKVTSSDEHLIHIADSIVHPLFLAKEDWYSTYDANPAQAIETKADLLKMCVSENALVFGAHFPFPGLGHVQQGEDGWKWSPIN